MLFRSPIDEETGKPMKYRLKTQRAAVRKFLRNDDHFTEYQKVQIIDAMTNGEQLEDVTLRRLVLEQLTRYINSRSKYYSRTLDDLMGE